MKLQVKKCPRCHRDYDEYPALSRTDNKTRICPSCGTAEAIMDFVKQPYTQESWGCEEASK